MTVGEWDQSHRVAYLLAMTVAQWQHNKQGSELSMVVS
jgi:hypothetical protein